MFKNIAKKHNLLFCKLNQTAMKKIGLLPALVQHRCPQCRQTVLYKNSAFNLLNYAAMHEKCTHCGLKFEVEPGFFYGAMYFSYAFSIATIVISFFCVYFLLANPPLWVYLTVICSILVLTMPMSFRYSRTLMLHFFGGVAYNEKL